MGEIAAEMLVRHIESKEVVPPQKVYLSAELVIRGSTRPPAGVAGLAAPGGPERAALPASVAELLPRLPAGSLPTGR
jgi:hypothetical protein